MLLVLVKDASCMCFPINFAPCYSDGVTMHSLFPYGFPNCYLLVVVVIKFFCPCSLNSHCNGNKTNFQVCVFAVTLGFHSSVIMLQC